MQKSIFSELSPNISVNCVTLGFSNNEIKILVNVSDKKKKKSAKNEYILPESLITNDESPRDTAKRILNDFTNPDKVYFEQLHTFGDMGRSKKSDDKWLQSLGIYPDERLITITYFALLKPDLFVSEQSLFDKKTEWISISKLPKLAFDHNKIIEKAFISLKKRLKFEALGIELLPNKFTLSNLQSLYEKILNVTFDKRNFRRKILKSGLFVKTMEKEANVTHKPAEYYTIDKEKYELLRNSDFDLSFINL